MVFNDVGQVVKAVINGSTLLTRRAVAEYSLVDLLED